MTKWRGTCFAWGMAICFAFAGGGAWAGVVCRDDGWKDRNNDTPRALPPDKGGSGLLLKCYLDTSDMWTSTAKAPKYGHFKIYFNRCDSSCEDEQMTDDDVKPVADFLECAWDLYVQREMASSSLLFKNPLSSNWMERTNASAPAIGNRSGA